MSKNKIANYLQFLGFAGSSAEKDLDKKPSIEDSKKYQDTNRRKRKKFKRHKK